MLGNRCCALSELVGVEDREDRGNGRVREDCKGGRRSATAIDSLRGADMYTLNVISRPFTTRTAFRGHGQLGLDIFFDLEAHKSALVVGWRESPGCSLRE